MQMVVRVRWKQEEVINIANIQSRLGNSFRITGINNPNEARQLSLLPRAGAALPPFRLLKNVPLAQPWVCRTLNRG